jgi:hypothetical protein
MKKQERYKLLKHAKKDYSEQLDRNYEFKKLSKKTLYELLNQNKHSAMCEWSYCCYGLYQSCWQEPIEEGNWNYTQEKVNDIIKYTIDSTEKICRKDNRVLYYEDEYGVHVIIVVRDIVGRDYLICFTNREDF